MVENIDKEIEAIKAVLHALEPLTAEVRASVLDYVMKRLQIVLAPIQHGQNSDISVRGIQAMRPTPEAVTEQQSRPLHIKDFKEKKNPRSATEMAALVAYYLANHAPEKDRKEAINTKDVETYFKIAEYPLGKLQFTLPNAKNAGYFDTAGSGRYKLNAVGHNLVVHSMPRGVARDGPSKRRGLKRPPRPATKRK
jgi:hypothetical protein